MLLENRGISIKVAFSLKISAVHLFITWIIQLQPLDMVAKVAKVTSLSETPGLPTGVKRAMSDFPTMKARGDLDVVVSLKRRLLGLRLIEKFKSSIKFIILNLQKW